jgi:alkanesulfonate monooxygenase SsuD/methylene tetrahydromethanopterin reductase-like flavin-dependent oxidoreductase (luciferase family)
MSSSDHEMDTVRGPEKSGTRDPATAGALIAPEGRSQHDMLIGVGLDARLGLPFAQLREAGREAAQLGFNSLWTPAGGVPDSFHVCAVWSEDTSLRTGISVVPAVQPATTTAAAIATS